MAYFNFANWGSPFSLSLITILICLLIIIISTIIPEKYAPKVWKLAISIWISGITVIGALLFFKAYSMSPFLIIFGITVTVASIIIVTQDIKIKDLKIKNQNKSSEKN